MYGISQELNTLVSKNRDVPDTAFNIWPDRVSNGYLVAIRLEPDTMGCCEQWYFFIYC